MRRAAEEALPTDARSPELVKRSVVDGYDRIFGVFITAAGKRRRVDFIFVPRPYEPFALLGW